MKWKGGGKMFGVKRDQVLELWEERSKARARTRYLGGELLKGLLGLLWTFLKSLVGLEAQVLE